MDKETLGPLVAVVFGLILVISGVLAYTGRYRSWLMLKSFLPGWPGLAGGYIGLMVLLAVFVQPLIDTLPGPLLLVVAAVAFGSMLLGIIGMFWLPRLLLPGWIREQQDQMVRGEDRFSRATRPGGALHGRLGVDRDPRMDRKNEDWRPHGGA
jgi:hypothetical protein